MNGQEEKGPSEKMKKGRQERKEGNKTSVVSLNPRKEYLDKKSCVIKTDWCLLELAAKEIVCVCVCESLSQVRLFATPWTAALQALLSMGFSRQEYWSGLPFPPPKEMVVW